jgi:hypothetical protein
MTSSGLARPGRPASLRLRRLDGRAILLLLPRQFVELVELGLQEPLVRQASLILGHERGRHGPAEGVLDDLAVFRGAQEDADRRPLVRLLHVPVERLQVELQLAEVFRLELIDLEFKRDQAVEARLKKRRSRAKSRPPTWSGYWLPTKQKSRPSSMRNCLRCSIRPRSRSPSEWSPGGRGTRRDSCP